MQIMNGPYCVSRYCKYLYKLCLFWQELSSKNEQEVNKEETYNRLDSIYLVSLSVIQFVRVAGYVRMNVNINAF